MITHESTRAIRGNCVLPWPCDLASACSQHSIPSPDLCLPPRKSSQVLCCCGSQRHWPYRQAGAVGGSRHSWLRAIWGYHVFHTWLGSVLSWAFINRHQQGPLSGASCSICPTQPPKRSSLTCSAVQKRIRNISHLGDLKVEVALAAVQLSLFL